MILYIESNFVLEIVLAQEQASHAEQLLSLAEARAIELAVPEFSINEPFSTLARRSNERNQLSALLSKELTQLNRSTHGQPLASHLHSVPNDLVQLQQRERDELDRVVATLLRVGRIMGLTSSSYVVAQHAQTQWGLSAQDAIIYGVVLSDARKRDAQEPKLFVSRNSKDFQDPDIIQELNAAGCSYLGDFQSCVGLLRANGIIPQAT